MMSIEIFHYLAPLQTGELSLLSFVLILALLCVPSFLAIYIAQRFVSSVRRFETSKVCAVALTATLLGLVLTCTVYNCDTCKPRTMGCRVVTIGIPFPQELGDRDREPPILFDACTLGSERSNVAVLGNFGLGAWGVPIGLLIAMGKRRKD
jgi:hypothetical protein